MGTGSNAREKKTTTFGLDGTSVEVYRSFFLEMNEALLACSDQNEMLPIADCSPVDLYKVAS